MELGIKRKTFFIAIGVSMLLIPVVILFVSLQYLNTEQSKCDTQEYTFYWEQLPLMNNEKEEMEFTKEHIKINNLTIRNALDLLISEKEREKIVEKSYLARYKLFIKRKSGILVSIEECFVKALEEQKFISVSKD